MKTKVNAVHLDRVSTAYRNATQVKTKTQSARHVTARLNLSTSKNPRVRAVAQRTEQVHQRINAQTAVMDQRSAESRKRAEFVRVEAAKASASRSPGQKVTLPRTTASIAQLRQSTSRLRTSTPSGGAKPNVRVRRQQPKRAATIVYGGAAETKPMKNFAKRGRTTERTYTSRATFRQGRPAQTVTTEVSKRTKSPTRGAPGAIRKLERTRVPVKGTNPTRTQKTTYEPRRQETERSISVQHRWQLVPGASVSIPGKHRGVDLEARADAFAQGAVKGEYKNGKLELSAGVEVGAVATVRAQKVWKPKGRYAPEVTVGVKGSVGAQGSAKANLTISRQKVHVGGKLEGFVGGQANVNGGLKVGAVEGKGSFGVSYGFGGSIGGEFEASWKRIHFKTNIGARIGLGLQGSAEIEINPTKVYNYFFPKPKPVVRPPAPRRAK
jgi:hypothetical protein